METDVTGDFGRVIFDAMKWGIVVVGVSEWVEDWWCGLIEPVGDVLAVDLLLILLLILVLVGLADEGAFVALFVMLVVVLAAVEQVLGGLESVSGWIEVDVLELALYAVLVLVHLVRWILIPSLYAVRLWSFIVQAETNQKQFHLLIVLDDKYGFVITLVITLWVVKFK